MSATKILWGQLLLVSVVVLAFLWAATEWTAWRLAFQPQLGPAWFMIERWPIYQPLAFFIWWFKFDPYAPGIFIQGGCIAACGGIAAMGVAISEAGQELSGLDEQLIKPPAGGPAGPPEGTPATQSGRPARFQWANRPGENGDKS